MDLQNFEPLVLFMWITLVLTKHADTKCSLHIILVVKPTLVLWKTMYTAYWVTFLLMSTQLTSLLGKLEHQHLQQTETEVTI